MAPRRPVRWIGIFLMFAGIFWLAGPAVLVFDRGRLLSIVLYRLGLDEFLLYFDPVLVVMGGSALLFVGLIILRRTRRSKNVV